MAPMNSDEYLNAIHSSKVGFEFEFFSDSDINKTKEGLTRTLSKRIRIEEMAHSAFTPTDMIYKLEPDNSGGSGMIELVTGPMAYPEAKIILAKTLKWIKENGHTNDRCSIHVNLAFDTEKMGPEFDMKMLDIGKFVLSFDEQAVYDEFPDREHSVYAKTIKFVMPLNGMVHNSPDKVNWKNYQFVNSKYYGVNFEKIVKGYIEFRYLGGKDYEKKYPKILKMMDHFISGLYYTLSDPTYNKKEEKELDKLLKLHGNVIKAFRSYEDFIKLYPKIKLSVDLQTSIQIVKMYYPNIRQRLFDLLTKADMKAGFVNYDSDQGKVQVKNAKLERCYMISGLDLVDCEISGNIENCDVFTSKIKDSSIINSNLFDVTTITDSKLESCYISRNVTLKNCYIYGINTVFSGKMTGGIFRKGRITKHGGFKDTEIIEYEKIK